MAPNSFRYRDVALAGIFGGATKTFERICTWLLMESVGQHIEHSFESLLCALHYVLSFQRRRRHRQAVAGNTPAGERTRRTINRTYSGSGERECIWRGDNRCASGSAWWFRILVTGYSFTGFMGCVDDFHLHDSDCGIFSRLAAAVDLPHGDRTVDQGSAANSLGCAHRQHNRQFPATEINRESH